MIYKLMRHRGENLSYEEWFDRLNEPYRTQAIVNCIDRHGGRHMQQQKAYSLEEAINAGLLWENTPEGSEYWNIIHNEISNDRNLDSYVRQLEDIFLNGEETGLILESDTSYSSILNKVRELPKYENIPNDIDLSCVCYNTSFTNDELKSLIRDYSGEFWSNPSSIKCINYGCPVKDHDTLDVVTIDGMRVAVVIHPLPLSK